MDPESRRGPHDIGGLEAGPIDTTDYGMAFWERQANGLRRTARANGLYRSDQLRRATESLGDRYYELGYFERSTVALRTVLVENGVFTDDELEAKVAEVRARYTGTDDDSAPREDGAP